MTLRKMCFCRTRIKCEAVFLLDASVSSMWPCAEWFCNSSQRPFTVSAQTSLPPAEKLEKPLFSTDFKQETDRAPLLSETQWENRTKYKCSQSPLFFDLRVSFPTVAYVSWQGFCFPLLSTMENFFLHRRKKFFSCNLYSVVVSDVLPHSREASSHSCKSVAFRRISPF